MNVWLWVGLAVLYLFLLFFGWVLVRASRLTGDKRDERDAGHRYGD
jgi:hypothetical protein